MEQLSIQEYLNNKKDIQSKLLEFVDASTNPNNYFDNLIALISDQKIVESPLEFKEFIRLLVQISNDHHRSPDFFDKIEQILLHYNQNIKKSFTNKEILDMFNSNKKLLLFVIENKFITVDQSLFRTLKSKNFSSAYYLNYLFPQVQQVIGRVSRKSYEKEYQSHGDHFFKYQKVGENESPLYQYIRNDSIDSFSSFFQMKRLPASKKVTSSIFETNSLLTTKAPSLLEYSAFFGSLKIFKFLILNGAEMEPSLWLYAIHGRNMEIIHIIEENEIEPDDSFYDECLREAILCHHNEIADYIINKYKIENLSNCLAASIECCNYLYFPENLTDNLAFYSLCKYNCTPLISYVISDTNLKVNETVVLNDILHYKIPLAILFECSFHNIFVNNVPITLNFKIKFQKQKILNEIFNFLEFE